MSIIEKKEKNLNQLINKLNSLTLTYSQPTYEIEKIKTLIFDRFNHHNIDLTQDNIEYEKIYTPDEWKNLFGLYKTSAFGASHNLFNIGPFRNKNKSNYKGLYYVGASTTPGTGLPMVTLSGKLVSDRIENDLS